jgi:hypothetical protein
MSEGRGFRKAQLYPALSQLDYLTHLEQDIYLMSLLFSLLLSSIVGMVLETDDSKRERLELNRNIPVPHLSGLMNPRRHRLRAVTSLSAGSIRDER